MAARDDEREKQRPRRRRPPSRWSMAAAASWAWLLLCSCSCGCWAVPPRHRRCAASRVPGGAVRQRVISGATAPSRPLAGPPPRSRTSDPGPPGRLSPTAWASAPRGGGGGGDDDTEGSRAVDGGLSAGKDKRVVAEDGDGIRDEASGAAIDAREGDVAPPAVRSPCETTSGAASSSDDRDEDAVFQLRHLDRRYAPKRGTRTTGAGASRRYNPSVFSPSSAAALSTATGWTAAALAGDVMERRRRRQRKAESRDAMKGIKNPMMGRLWAGRSKRGTLILKFPGRDADGGALYVELSESIPGQKTSTRPSAVAARYVTRPGSGHTDHEDNGVAQMPFIPLEGIYGVYNLPCSGSHVVLITESEGAYVSPPSSRSAVPLLELRRIKSLEIVSLRPKSDHDSDAEDEGDQEGSATTRLPTPAGEQMAEEARQLRLLRRSFKEHDLYFTVPRDGGESVVRDVTQTLQRSFLGRAASNKKEEQNSDNNRWWAPYAEEGVRSLDGVRSSRAVDSRFFWNERPALLLLPPSRGNATSPSSSSVSSAHTLLLDHVVPVTSAFLGVRRGVLVPSPPNEATLKESYDQVLISRRSRYRTGTRFTRRGADGTGAVANYAETEQICVVVAGGVDGGGDAEDDCCTVRGQELLEVYSHVQTRGSIPLHWSSPANVREYRPRVYIGVDPLAQARGLRDHLLGELWLYSSSSADQGIRPRKKTSQQTRVTGVGREMCAAGPKIAMVNLIDKHGDQGRLGRAFDSVLLAVQDIYAGSPSGRQARKLGHGETEATGDLHSLCPGSVEHVWYDFHAECRGGRWDRLSILLQSVAPAIDSQGYFCVVPCEGGDDDAAVEAWEILCVQDGVVRTNCMDCLDRTNVVQSMFSRHALYRQLHERPGLVGKGGGHVRRGGRTLPLECVVGYRRQPLSLPWPEGEAAHRHLWADNADAISRLYAGTPALKGDFTRTGKRTRRGAIDDGVNSLQRYYLNNFVDADRQEGMDLLVGSADFNVVPGNNDRDESSRVFVMQELAERSRRRRGYDMTHARIKTSPGRTSPLHGVEREGEGRRRLSLKWLPGDLHRHMRDEALRSRSPLSAASAEEDVVDAPTSSDFLLRVTSAAAMGEEAVSSVDTDGLEYLHSINKRALSARPWWESSGDTVQGRSSSDGGVALDARLHGAQDVALGFTKKRVVTAYLMLLTSAPVLSAALVTAAVALGFSSMVPEETGSKDSE